MALVGQIAGYVLFAPLLLRLPIRIVDNLLSPGDAKAGGSSDRIEKILRYTDAVCGRLRRLIPSRCLARGITLFYLLRKAGLPVGLEFGIERHCDGGKGHCWLVLNDEPFAEKVDPRKIFIPMYSIGRGHGHRTQSDT
jgi:hypothetical protein